MSQTASSQQPTQQPRPPISRIGRKICRYGLGLLAVVISLFIIALLFLNLWLIPRIDLYRSDIENSLTERLGAPVHIGQITAHRNGILLPTIEITDIRIESPLNTLGLEIAQVRATISLAALSRFDIQFSELLIENPVVQIEQLPNNVLQIAGLNIAQFGNNSNTISGEIPGFLLWLLRQPRIEVRQGHVSWSDQTIDASDINLQEIDISITANGRHRAIELQATPSENWGERFTIKLDLTAPLFASPKEYANWEATAYALFPHIDIKQLPDYITLPITITQGHGYVEVRGQYQQGQLIESRATLNLPDMQLQASPDLPFIHLQDFQGTITGSWRPNVYQIQTNDLTFRTPASTLADGTYIPEQTWPTSSMDIRWQFDNDGNLNGGSLQTGVISLNLLAQLTLKLPLPSPIQNILTEINPQGRIEHLALQWEGPPNAPQTYTFQGKLQDLAATAAARVPPAPGKRIRISRPGFENLSLEFNFNENQGQAQFSIDNGSITLPGLYDSPYDKIEIRLTDATIQWQRLANGRYHAQTSGFEIQAPDAQLELQIQWDSPDPQNPLDIAGDFLLTGKIINSDVRHVARYIPVSVQQRARDYVQAALISGSVPEATVYIEGPLADFPYHNTDTGVFLIEGNAVNVTYDFAPEVARKPGQGPWPTLTQVNGHARFTSRGMRISNARGQVLGAPDIHLIVDEVTIPNWNNNDTHIFVEGNITGPADQILHTINTTAPGIELLNGMLAPTTATGPLNAKLQLDIALNRMPDSRAQGQVTFNDNTILLWPFTPELQHTQGTLFFTEQGFSISHLQGETLGGLIQGHAQWQRNHGIQMQLSGELEAQALFADPNWGYRLWPQLEWLHGRTPYTIEAHINNGLQEFTFQSNLTGLGINLPEPFTKAPEQPYPLHVRLTPLVPASQNRFLPLYLEANTPATAITAATTRPLQTKAAHTDASSATHQLPRIQAYYLIDYSSESSSRNIDITQGTLGINQEPAMPLTGTTAYIQLDYLNVPEWKALLSHLPTAALTADAATNTSIGISSTNTLHVQQQNSRQQSASPINPTLPVWWPQTTSAHIQTLYLGQALPTHHTRLQIQRLRQNWSAQVTSEEIIAHLQWESPAVNNREPANPGNGLLRTRFARLWLPEFSNETNNSKATKIKTHADADANSDNGNAIAPTTLVRFTKQLISPFALLPNIEAYVNDLRFGSIQLGNLALNARLDLESVPPSWQIDTLRVTNEYATFLGHGYWVNVPYTISTLEFTIETPDAGLLINRLGHPDLLAESPGYAQGLLHWRTAPYEFDLQTLQGQFTFTLGKGRFLPINPGAARLLGLFGLQTLSNRLTLDFRDLFSKGLAFNHIHNQSSINNGVLSVETLELNGVNANINTTGTINLIERTQQLQVIVKPQVNAGIASLALIFVNPAIGFGTFAAQVALQEPLNNIATRTYYVSGTWSTPEISQKPHKPLLQTP